VAFFSKDGEVMPCTHRCTCSRVDPGGTWTEPMKLWMWVKRHTQESMMFAWCPTSMPSATVSLAVHSFQNLFHLGNPPLRSSRREHFPC